MKNELVMTPQMTDLIVKICFDVSEFYRFYEYDHPESAKNIFECNDDIKKKLKCFINSDNPKGMLSNIDTYLQSVKIALQLYNNLYIPIEGKNKLIIQLKNLQIHLTDLQNQIQSNT